MVIIESEDVRRLCDPKWHVRVVRATLFFWSRCHTKNAVIQIRRQQERYYDQVGVRAGCLNPQKSKFKTNVIQMSPKPQASYKWLLLKFETINLIVINATVKLSFVKPLAAAQRSLYSLF